MTNTTCRILWMPAGAAGAARPPLGATSNAVTTAAATHPAVVAFRMTIASRVVRQPVSDASDETRRLALSRMYFGAEGGTPSRGRRRLRGAGGAQPIASLRAPTGHNC